MAIISIHIKLNIKTCQIKLTGHQNIYFFYKKNYFQNNTILKLNSYLSYLQVC